MLAAGRAVVVDVTVRSVDGRGLLSAGDPVVCGPVVVTAAVGVVRGIRLSVAVVAAFGAVSVDVTVGVVRGRALLPAGVVAEVVLDVTLGVLRRGGLVSAAMVGARGAVVVDVTVGVVRGVWLQSRPCAAPRCGRHRRGGCSLALTVLASSVQVLQQVMDARCCHSGIDPVVSSTCWVHVVVAGSGRRACFWIELCRCCLPCAFVFLSLSQCMLLACLFAVCMCSAGVRAIGMSETLSRRPCWSCSIAHMRFLCLLIVARCDVASRDGAFSATPCSANVRRCICRGMEARCGGAKVVGGRRGPLKAPGPVITWLHADAASVPRALQRPTVGHCENVHALILTKTRPARGVSSPLPIYQYRSPSSMRGSCHIDSPSNSHRTGFLDGEHKLCNDGDRRSPAGREGASG